MDRQKRLFFLAGKTGSGKTAMASTICKLYRSDVIANHFFDTTQDLLYGNHMTGLIQSLAADMCRTFPEYLAYLNDTYGENSDLLANQLQGNWESYYHALLKDLLTAVFGSGSRASPGNVVLTLFVLSWKMKNNNPPSPPPKNPESLTCNIMKIITLNSACE